MSARRCDGRCCRSFTLTIVDAGVRTWLVEPTQLTDPTLRALMFVRDVEPAVDETPAYARFECRAFDAERGECGIYDARPDVCRRYPASQPCEFCGATTHDDAVGPAEAPAKPADLPGLDKDI